MGKVGVRDERGGRSGFRGLECVCELSCVLATGACTRARYSIQATTNSAYIAQEEEDYDEEAAMSASGSRESEPEESEEVCVLKIPTTTMNM